jgi:hypothetical protein
MDASTAIQSRLIGAIFVEKNLITEEQLERALQLQAETGDRLGEIVVAEFGVARLELASVLAEQWAELEQAEREVAADPDHQAQVVEPLTPAEVQIRRPLGEIFVELGFITSDQLDAALETQRETGARIGEILVEQGSLTRLDLASALAEQWSALQKLRPPAPVADPQPWQNGSPVTPPPALESSSDDHASVAALEERLRVVERTAGGAPWQEDLRLVTADLRAAVSAVEKRLEAAVPGTVEMELAAALESVNTRIDALESVPVSIELVALRQELDGLKTRSVTVEGLDELRAAVERLEGRPDRVDEVTHLAGEIAALATRLDELVGAGDLTDKLDAVAEQAEVAQTGIAGLSRRVDDLAGLESRVDEMVARLPDEDAIEELRRALAELSTQAGNDDPAGQGAEIASLVARFDQLAVRVEDVAATPVSDLTPRIDEVAAAIPVVATDGLAARIESLEEGSRTGNGALERLATELNELGSRTQARLEALASQEPDLAPVDELRTRVDDLAAAVEREPDLTALAELRARVDDLAGAVEREPDTAPLDEIRARLDEVAAATLREPDSAAVDELRLRVNLLAATVARQPDKEPIDEIRAQLDELAAAVERDESVSSLEGRVGELEHRLAAAMPNSELREEMRRVAESTVAERESLAQALFARVEEITQTAPREEELTELRSRLDELAARPTVDHGLQARVDEVAARLEGLGAVEGTIADLRTSLEGLDGQRVGDALAMGTRIDGLEATIDSIAGLEARLRQGIDRELADRAKAFAARLDGAENRLDTVAALEERVAALASDLEQRPDGDALVGVAAELRAELAALADQSTTAEPSERLLELSQKVDALGERADGLVRADEAAATTAEQAAWVRAELEALREATEARAGAVDSALAEADHARTTGQQELGNRVDEAVAELRKDLKAKANAFGSQLQTHSSETAALRASVEELQEATAGRATWEARFESMLEQRLDGLASRITDEVGAAREEAEQAAAALSEATGSLEARIEKLFGLRQAEMQTARTASERLAERVEALTGLRTDDAEAARAAAEDLSARLESLAESLHAEAADARAAAEGVATKFDDLQGLRAADLAAADSAGAELAARLDDHAVRSAAAAFEVEQALREELGGIAARLEERDAQGIEAREDLRGELERVASSVGWRLERIEESLAADDSAELKAMVAELERRLEGQVAMGAEQVRVTERALRKGLASLGERLVDSESAYVEAGNTFRRSIERLGAAVVEADARMADQIPVSEAEGCVAFAPTAAGYRLVELPGKPPEVGSTVELEACDGPLVVTRFGRSPLPLDNRSCAYLDRA